jgi:hypothetical protein
VLMRSVAVKTNTPDEVLKDLGRANCKYRPCA